jgi:hypothetical protein
MKLGFKTVLVTLIILSSQSILANYNIFNQLKNEGKEISKQSTKWLKRYEGINLEDLSSFQYKEISGTTSINLKIQKIDSTDPKGYKSYGSFVPLNSSANPNAEIAYFNLAMITGVDFMFRPTVRYELGVIASQEFKKIILNSTIKGEGRIDNKNNILKRIDSNQPLKGCLKAKKSDFSIGYDEIIKPTTFFNRNGGVRTNHPLVKLIQANNAQPAKEKQLELKSKYSNSEYQLAREFSILLTFDAIFGQYDRFSGGNVVIELDENNLAHIVASDNGGAEIINSLSNTKATSRIFSRYDKQLIEKLKSLNHFLKGDVTSYLNYTNPEEFIVDLGMYFIKSPGDYLKSIKANLNYFLNFVHENEERYGQEIYFVE